MFLDALALFVLVQGVVSVRVAPEGLVLGAERGEVLLDRVDVLEDVGRPRVHQDRVVDLMSVGQQVVSGRFQLLDHSELHVLEAAALVDEFLDYQVVLRESRGVHMVVHQQVAEQGSADHPHNSRLEGVKLFGEPEDWGHDDQPADGQVGVVREEAHDERGTEPVREEVDGQCRLAALQQRLDVVVQLREPIVVPVAAGEPEAPQIEHVHDHVVVGVKIRDLNMKPSTSR